MTKEQALNLTPGQKLTWKKRPQNEIDEDNWFFARTGKRLPRVGYYPQEMYEKSFGSTVEFVDFQYNEDRNIRLDMRGFPIIFVKTNKTEKMSSSSANFE